MANELMPGWRIKHRVLPKSGRHDVTAINIEDYRRSYSATAETFDGALDVVKMLIHIAERSNDG